MSKRILIIESREWLLRLVEQAIHEEQPDDEIVLASTVVDGLEEAALIHPDVIVLGTYPEEKSLLTVLLAFATALEASMPPALSISSYLSSEDERPIFVEIDRLQAAVSAALAPESVAAGRR